MYNAELKQQYLSDTEHKNTNLRNLMELYFGKCERFEKLLDKDCSNFTVVEIIDFCKSLCFTSFETLMVIISQFKIYTDYCLNRNLIKDNQNHYYEITYELIKDCINYGLINEQIISRNDLIHIISQLNNPSDKFMVLAIFEGISGQNMCELCDIKLSDFNGNEVTLCTGRKLQVSDYLVKLAKLSDEAYDYYAYTKSGDEKVYKYNPNDNHILKDIYNARSESNKRQRLYSKLVRIRKYLDANCIGLSSLMESGRIQCLLDIQNEEGGEIRQILVNHKELEYRYGRVFSYSRYILKYSEIIEKIK